MKLNFKPKIKKIPIFIVFYGIIFQTISMKMKRPGNSCLLGDYVPGLSLSYGKVRREADLDPKEPKVLYFLIPHTTEALSHSAPVLYLSGPVSCCPAVRHLDTPYTGRSPRRGFHPPPRIGVHGRSM